MAPLVSIITPTFDRERYLPLVYEAFRLQAYPKLEWLIWDDSPMPSSFIQGLKDDRVRYFFDTIRRNNGTKRNRLIEAARGKYIVQFDDDDYYSPAHVQSAVERLEAGADFVSLSGFFIYTAVHKLFGYWDTHRIIGFSQRWGPEPVTVHYLSEKAVPAMERNQLGYGFSFAYRKAVYEWSQYNDDAWGSDYHFVRTVIQKGARFRSFPDQTGLSLHILRQENVSCCFPNYVLPPFMLKTLFPTMPQAWLDLG